MRNVMFIAVLVLLSPAGIAVEIYVPDDQPTIQDAVNHAAAGDTIIVRPGTYRENIDFLGKAITIRSETGPHATVIDGRWIGSVVTFKRGEGPDSRLEEFTIENGRSLSGGGINCLNRSSPTITGNVIINNFASFYIGGGISCDDRSNPTITNNIIDRNISAIHGGGICCYNGSDPTITNNRITRNVASCGGGICSYRSDPTIACNVITSNRSELYGGGITYKECRATVSGNLISENTATAGVGGGICCDNSNLIINNNTLTENTAIFGGGICCDWWASAIVANTILWDNSAGGGPEIFLGGTYWPSDLTISYSDVQGGQSSVEVEPQCTLIWGTGMIADDPLFMDQDNDDLHLTWDSPCRNSGDSAVITDLHDVEGDPRIAYASVDMGADEFHTHLYHTGAVIPGEPIRIKVVGNPGADPVGLGLGFGVLDPPLQTSSGLLYLAPPMIRLKLWAIPGSGILTLQVDVPQSALPGEEYPFQALVGTYGDPDSMFTNLMILQIE